MSILTAKRVWKRRKLRPTLQGGRRLNPEECEQVRLVLRHLEIEMGSPAVLANALGMSRAALAKARQPSRQKSVSLALLLARVAGVTITDVLTGRWERNTCPKCGHVGAHPRAT